MGSKVQPTEHEKAVISALDSASGLTREGGLGKRRGRKRPRGPNPLSVKKGRRKFVTSQPLPGSVSSQSKVTTYYSRLHLCTVIHFPHILCSSVSLYAYNR